MLKRDGSKEGVFLDIPHVMGIVNVTPDSFSDGGCFLNKDKAIEHGLQLVHDGASILDIGGESTRPGAQPVDVEEEIGRIVPVIEGLKGKVSWISVDTRNSKTMVAALKAGANIVNDISALTYDNKSIHVVSEAQVPVFIMHSKGTPQDMQKNPQYYNVVSEVFQYLQERIKALSTHRIEKHSIIVDPGIGFGKTLEHNLLLLGNIRKFHDLGVPIMLGASRKSFISELSKDEPVNERISGSISAALWGVSQGVQIFRVHDVKETVQAFKVHEAISSLLLQK